MRLPPVLAAVPARPSAVLAAVAARPPAVLAAMAARPPAVLAAVAIALASSSGCSSGHPTGISRQTFDGAVFPAGLRAHRFTLTDQGGSSVSLDASGGHVRVLAFLSTAGRTGALVAQQIRGALDELGGRATEVTALLVSDDATTPRARGTRFLREASLAGRAELLTGPPGRLRTAWKTYSIPPASAGERAYLASTPVILVDRHGFERVGFPVEQLTPEALAHDIGALAGGA